MLSNILKSFFHLISILLLTITTQIGGVIYFITILLIKKQQTKYRLKRFLIFLVIYLATTLLIIPKIAPFFGRTKITNNQNITHHNLITILCNRNYVSLKMKASLFNIASNFHREYPELKLVYLDASFPFFDGFPLLPHLSHNDGKKIDVSFIYEDKTGNTTNHKPSNSGYGVFENPLKKEFNQTQVCKEQGYWQYDFTKYLTFGLNNKKLTLSNRTTKRLMELILQNKDVNKLFIETHLINRLNIKNTKLRFHGCSAVRHDDHIHFQIK